MINHAEVKGEAAWRIPLPSAYFTGQAETLERLAEIMAAEGRGGITQPTGLRGFGGIGKTELALAYAQAYGERYDVGHFIVAESLAALDVGLARIADPDLSAKATEAQIEPLKAQALQKLAQAKRALVVFDNVDEIVRSPEFKGVLAALPRAHVLLTCRHQDMGDHVKQIEVAKMDEGVGALYVLRLGLGDEKEGPWDWETFSESDRENATLLSQDLEGLPLALHHAGSAIRGESLTVGEALADYRSNRSRILSNRGEAAEATHPASAQLTVVRALERLREKSSAAAEIVVCCAFLAPEAIAEDLFTGGMFELPEPLADRIDRFTAIRAVALGSALIERVPDEGRLTIHRVTQAILQEAEGTSAISRLTAITNRTVMALFNAGRYREAVIHAEFGASERARLLGAEHPETLTSLNNLAATYSALGRHAEALALKEETLAARREALGPRHPDTLTSMNNLASTYSALGRHAEALALKEETLAAHREALGPRHPDTLRSMNNLAQTYSDLGRHDEALALFERSFQGFVGSLGHDHPSTQQVLRNLEACRASQPQSS